MHCVVWKLQYYDIRKKCVGPLCYDFSNVEKLFEQEKVKRALGVGKGLHYVACSDKVYEALSQDSMKNLAVGIPALLEDGINVLLYHGEKDLICNWLGEPALTHLKQKCFCIEKLMCQSY